MFRLRERDVIGAICCGSNIGSNCQVQVSVVPGQDDHQRNILGLYSCNTESLSLRSSTKTFTPHPLLRAHLHQSFLSNILNPVTWERDHLFHRILSLGRMTNKEPYTAAICRQRERLGFSQFYHKCWMTLGKSLPSLRCFCEMGIGAPFSLHLTAFEHCTRILNTVKGSPLSVLLILGCTHDRKYCPISQRRKLRLREMKGLGPNPIASKLLSEELCLGPMIKSTVFPTPLLHFLGGRGG